jgi:hypothetical protein
LPVPSVPIKLIVIILVFSASLTTSITWFNCTASVVGNVIAKLWVPVQTYLVLTSAGLTVSETNLFFICSLPIVPVKTFDPFLE